jgi:hypothetical protein
MRDRATGCRRPDHSVDAEPSGTLTVWLNTRCATSTRRWRMYGSSVTPIATTRATGRAPRRSRRVRSGAPSFHRRPYLCPPFRRHREKTFGSWARSSANSSLPFPSTNPSELPGKRRATEAAGRHVPGEPAPHGAVRSPLGRMTLSLRSRSRAHFRRLVVLGARLPRLEDEAAFPNSSSERVSGAKPDHNFLLVRRLRSGGSQLTTA